MPRYWSYLRYSTPEQALGDAERRQVEAVNGRPNSATSTSTNIVISASVRFVVKTAAEATSLASSKILDLAKFIKVIASVWNPSIDYRVRVHSKHLSRFTI